ncbi:acyl-CoA dehydrogenase [Herpetosiphon geysericola]|uniref:Acyl-CoA dehydrogenase n=1 Tax=Herpetosiphon geysericola TaxID=70996 RepID=A0A0P6XFD2_9CHLR|nr:acyl-CoA dehydrogenase [Herpetosiphon geysericola]KPL81971.1 acyl-CoA dehydrogenase [Herpetosiphon geysericola]
MDFQLTQEQQELRQTVREFAERELLPKAKEVDEKAQIPASTWKKMADTGLMGLPFAEELGGAGADAISAALAVEEIARCCGSTALSYAAHVGLGSAPIAMFGNDQQKEQFLRPAAEGRYLGAFGLTEPHAGSDAGSTRTTAVREGNEWVINGAKMWITNAAEAGHLIVTAITNKDRGKRGISAIIIPQGTPGVHFGSPEHKMGLRGSNTHAITFDNVRVPAENLLGAEGDGFVQFLKVLDGGRISIGAMAIGLGVAAMEAAVSYARERQAFGHAIGSYQSISNMLADMDTELEAARLLILRAAWLKENGKPFTREAAIAKLYASEASERACRNAVQIFGGYGYSSEYPVERYYRDTRLLTIGEGTSEILRMVISRGLLGELA